MSKYPNGGGSSSPLSGKSFSAWHWTCCLPFMTVFTFYYFAVIQILVQPPRLHRPPWLETVGCKKSEKLSIRLERPVCSLIKMTQSNISRVGSSQLPTQPCSYPELVGTGEIWHHWFQSRTLKIFRIIQPRHFVIFTKEIRCQPNIEKTHYHNHKPLPRTSTVLDWSETQNKDSSVVYESHCTELWFECGKNHTISNTYHPNTSILYLFSCE